MRVTMTKRSYKMYVVMIRAKERGPLALRLWLVCRRHCPFPLKLTKNYCISPTTHSVVEARTFVVVAALHTHFINSNDVH